MYRSFVAAFVLCSALACTDRGPATADLAITHATIIDVGDGTLEPDQTVFVKGNRITAIRPSARATVPQGATIVDATGRYLIPGLWDAHVHSAGSVAWHFPLLVAYGVTGVRNMHSTADTALALTNAIKRRLAARELLGPRFLANGPIIDGYPPTWPGTVVAQTPGEGRAAVDSLAAGGADFIKVYDALTRETFLAIADEAHRRGIPVDGHMPMLVPPEDGAAAGMRTVEHLTGITAGCSAKADSLREEYTAFLRQMPELPFPQSMIGFFRLVRAWSDTRDPARCAATVEAYQAAGVTVVPTFIAFTVDPQTVLGDSAALRALPPAVRGEWTGMAASGLDAIMSSIMDPVIEHARENARLLHAGGVTILAGTDLGNPYLVPGASLHDELAELVDVGLSPLEALRSATLNPAIVFGLADSLGAVAEGMVADLVLLDANPLDDIHNTRSIEAVMLNGRYLDRSALDSLIATASAGE